MISTGNSKNSTAATAKSSGKLMRRSRHCRSALVLSLAAASPWLAATHASAQALIPGTVTSWGVYPGAPGVMPPAGLKDVIAISEGALHSLALKKDGTVVHWGRNEYGEGTIPAGLTDVKAIEAGGSYSMALRKDGTVVLWGFRYNGSIDVPVGLKDIKAISAGGLWNLALRTDGTVVGWGQNFEGNLNIPPGLTNVKAIAAASGYSVALKEDGTVVSWGTNYGQGISPVGLKDVKAIAAKGSHGLALKTDGTVVGWGANSYGQATPPAGLKGVVAITVGGTHSVAVKSDGTVVAWGANDYRQLEVPPGLSGVTTVSAGFSTRTLAANIPLEQDTSPYELSGFLAPVINPGAVNMGKAGRTYPIKFQLKDEDGNFVSSLDAVESITYRAAQCGAFNNTTSAGLLAVANGKNQLKFDAGSNSYHYNWASPSAGCYALRVTLKTGQVQQAYFNLTK